MSPLFVHALGLLVPASFFALGVHMLIAPEKHRLDAVRSRKRALQARLRRGRDRYFEELRTLQAYGQPRDTRTVRIHGIGNILLSAVLFLFHLS